MKITEYNIGNEKLPLNVRTIRRTISLLNDPLVLLHPTKVSRMKRRLTHYAPRQTEPGRWVPVAFLTRRIGEPTGPFFYGFESSRYLTSTDVERLEESGTLARLTNSYNINGEQLVWLAPENDVWLASTIDPVGDKSRILISNAGRSNV